MLIMVWAHAVFSEDASLLYAYVRSIGFDTLHHSQQPLLSTLSLSNGLPIWWIKKRTWVACRLILSSILPPPQSFRL